SAVGRGDGQRLAAANFRCEVNDRWNGIDGNSHGKGIADTEPGSDRSRNYSISCRLWRIGGVRKYIGDGWLAALCSAARDATGNNRCAPDIISPRRHYYRRVWNAVDRVYCKRQIAANADGLCRNFWFEINNDFSHRR